METVDVLKKARVLISIGWCRKTSAKDMYGRKVKFNAPDACHFDLFAALHRAAGPYGEPLRQAEQLLRDKVGGVELIHWNDAQKAKSAVLKLLDETIREEEARCASCNTSSGYSLR